MSAALLTIIEEKDARIRALEGDVARKDAALHPIVRTLEALVKWADEMAVPDPERLVMVVQRHGRVTAITRDHLRAARRALCPATTDTSDAV